MLFSAAAAAFSAAAFSAAAPTIVATVAASAIAATAAATTAACTAECTIYCPNKIDCIKKIAKEKPLRCKQVSKQIIIVDNDDLP